MSSVEQRTQKFTQGLIKKQAQKWYDEWSQNWIIWIVILALILVICFWILSGRDLPDICNFKPESDSESEPEELEELADMEYCDIEAGIRIDPFTGAIIDDINAVDDTADAPKPRKFGSKGEQITCETLESVYGKPFPTVRPNFLKNPETNRNLELDCFNDKLRLAAEYSGEQHYNFPNRFHKTRQEFMKQVRRDRLKAEICELQGIHLITVPWTIVHQLIPDFVKYHLPENVKARRDGVTEPIKHNWIQTKPACLKS